MLPCHLYRDHPQFLCLGRLLLYSKRLLRCATSLELHRQEWTSTLGWHSRSCRGCVLSKLDWTSTCCLRQGRPPLLRWVVICVNEQQSPLIVSCPTWKTTSDEGQPVTFAISQSSTSMPLNKWMRSKSHGHRLVRLSPDVIVARVTITLLASLA